MWSTVYVPHANDYCPIRVLYLVKVHSEPHTLELMRVAREQLARMRVTREQEKSEHAEIDLV